MKRHVQVVVNGQVVNKGFRLFALMGSVTYGIKGNVRQDSGNVIIEAEGEENDVNAFILYCRTGPPASMIESLNINEKRIVGYDDFKIL
jgi:acylphosphatase